MQTPTKEPSWSVVEHDRDLVWSRPLLGSELLCDQGGVSTGGTADTSFGLTISTSIPFDEVASRLRYAIAHLRFTTPLIAATLKSGVHYTQTRSWVYTPVRSFTDILNWAKDAVLVLPDRVSADDLVVQLARTRLPYVLPNGRELIFRCVLARAPGDEQVTLVFHSTQCIPGARSALCAFALVLAWMANPHREPLRNLPWGDEVGNLPAGPVTETEGLEPNRETDGSALMDKVVQERTNELHSLCLTPQRSEPSTPGNIVKSVSILDEERTAQVYAATEAAGCTLTQLIEAAHTLAILSYNNTHTADPRPESLLVALREEDTPRARLISVMRACKGLDNAIRSEPHFSQDCAVTNIGVTERWLADAWYANGTPNRNLYGEESPVFEVVDLAVGRRVTQPSPVCHVWTMQSKLHVQVLANDRWDEPVLRGFGEQIMKQALHVLDSD